MGKCLVSFNGRYYTCKVLLKSQNLLNKKPFFLFSPSTFLNHSFSSTNKSENCPGKSIGSFHREILNSNTFFVMVKDQPCYFQTFHIWDI